MRRAIVIGRLQGQKALTTLIEPTDPRSANDAYKALLAKPGELAELELCSLDVTKRKKFAAAGTPAAASSPAPSAPAPVAPDAEPPAADPTRDSAFDESEDGPSLLPSKSKSKK